MQLLTLLEHCGQLLSIIDKSSLPGDRLTSEYLRSKKYIGSKERRFIVDTVFSTLRNIILIKKLLNDAIIEGEVDFTEKLKFRNTNNKNNIFSLYAAIQIILVIEFPEEYSYFSPYILLKKINQSYNNIKSSLIKEFELLGIEQLIIKSFIELISIIAKRLFNNCRTIESLMLRYSFPLEFIEQLHLSELLDIESCGHKNLEISNLENNTIIGKDTINSEFSNTLFNNFFHFAKEFNKPAPICIRVNSITSTREKTIKWLEAAGVNCNLGKLSPSCIVIPQRVQLTEFMEYKRGEFEIQEEASQLVAYALNPQKNALVLDACAGAGGKSLHIADLQEDKGTIIANDIEFMRLKEIDKRAKRAGIKSIEAVMLKKDFYFYNINNKNKSKSNKKIESINYKDKFDYVLIDAPCSGSGTIRREPLKKYRINKKLINKIADKQLEILSNFAKYVRPNGYLVYSTCSIFPKENEEVLKKFLLKNTNFVPEPLKPNFLQYNIDIKNLADDAFYLTLYPFVYNTDGFFISKIRRLN